MEKTSFFKWVAMTALIIVAVGCQEESLQLESSANCEGCAGIGTASDVSTALLCGDLIVSKISITSIQGNYFHYNITFKNIGQGTIYIEGNNTINTGGYQARLSKDNVLASGDPGAGGSTIAGGPSFYLYTGQTYIREAHYSPATPFDISVYQYLFVTANPQEGSNECNDANNTLMTKVAYPTQL